MLMRIYKANFNYGMAVSMLKKMEYTYKLLFCIFVIIGAAASLGSVIGFSDAMIFAMMVPNMIGLVLLAPRVKDELKKYMNAIKNSNK
jgi:AGCS family alanine or glycine:cation symporter